ncbi:MAG TPA: GNAT family N-acetyltransferase [Propioniciclava tarda]|nr:GNAT family N-acetyltransferase [Propioniciclava tarda]
MIIDAATLDDLDAIMALEAEGFDHGHWSADAWRSELLGADRRVLVARDASVIGVATFQLVADTADLHRVIVAAERRRQGVGRQLVQAGIEWASRLGATEMLLEVDETNAPALRAYEGLGFQRLARRDDYYGTGLHALVMALELAEARSLT